jgi:hypothetical protein
MPKHDVYSWRLSRARKSALEQLARERNTTIASVLDEAVDNLMHEGSGTDDEAQARMRRTALSFIGAVRGGDPSRAANARAHVRAELGRRRRAR